MSLKTRGFAQEEALAAGAWVDVTPNTSARRALLGDKVSSVRIAALQALAGPATHIGPFIVNPQPSTLNPQPSTLNPQS